MKICVVCQNYPSSKQPEIMAFTHARDVLYKKYGHEVTVLSFSAKAEYSYDGIEVLPESAFTPERVAAFDIFVFHAPNLRNHLRFILRHGGRIKAKAIIAHGHEFIDWCNQVGRPYDYAMTWAVRARVAMVRSYDSFKIYVWSWYFRRQEESSLTLIFVSRWLRELVESCLNLKLSDHVRVYEINNPVHPVFRQTSYDPGCEKAADFVTIRPFDNPKYAIDVVRAYALENPHRTFHVYGNGEYFNHHAPPSNMTIIKAKFKQTDMPKLLNRYRAAFLPTRWDSQGVLMCEMACYGMPVVVSDLPICRLMVGEFSNLTFVSNVSPGSLELPSGILTNQEHKQKFDPERTVLKELEAFDETIRGSKAEKSLLKGSYVLSHVLALLNGFLREKRHVSG